MDEKDPNQKTPRKVKFQPVKNPKRAVKTKARDDEDAEEKRAFNEAVARGLQNLTKPRRKEKKDSEKTAFGPGESSSLSTRSAKEQNTRMIDPNDDTANASVRKIKKDDKKPLNDKKPNYPMRLPWRKPDSGDPEKLDEEEFVAAPDSVEYNENTVNSARELGLLDNSKEHKMIFFQFPPDLPMFKEPESGKGKEKIGASTQSSPPKKLLELNKLPEGCMGKMLVFKSGAVKLKLGEILLDVSPGTNRKFAQDAVAINTAKKHCVDLGPITNNAVVTADIVSHLP